MNTRLRTLIFSATPIEDTHSVWIDTTTDLLKYFKNGVWTVIKDPTVSIESIGAAAVDGSATQDFYAGLLAATTVVASNFGFAGNASGTFVANGLTPVVITGKTGLFTTSIILISLNTTGGTPGTTPTVSAIAEDGTGFTVVATEGDTSVYNYVIFTVIV